MTGTRFDPENILQIQNSGWSCVICCACFSYAGIGPIGSFNSDQFVEYLENNVMPCAERVFPDMDFYILHHNSRIHTSYQRLAYLVLRFGPQTVITHAPHSPHCNPIENLFGLLTRQINKNTNIFNT
jgi:hypothetical protein